MRALHVVAVAALVLIGFPVKSQSLLPLDIDALYCLGVIQLQEREHKEFISSLSRSERNAASIQNTSPYEKRLSSLRAYIAVRLIENRTESTASIVIGLVKRGENEASQCKRVRASLFETPCFKQCARLFRPVEGQSNEQFIEHFRKTMDNCAASCPGGIESRQQCRKPDGCDKIGDRIPL